MRALALLLALAASPRPAPSGTVCVGPLDGYFHLGKETLTEEPPLEQLKAANAVVHHFVVEVDGQKVELAGDRGAKLEVPALAEGPHRLTVTCDGRRCVSLEVHFPEDGQALRLLPATYGGGFWLSPMGRHRCRWPAPGAPDGGR